MSLYKKVHRAVFQLDKNISHLFDIALDKNTSVFYDKLTDSPTTECRLITNRAFTELVVVYINQSRLLHMNIEEFLQHHYHDWRIPTRTEPRNLYWVGYTYLADVVGLEPVEGAKNITRLVKFY